MRGGSEEAHAVIYVGKMKAWTNGAGGVGSDASGG